MSKKQNGFTTIELVVTVGIIGILALSMVYFGRDSLRKARESRANQDCRTLADSIIQFHKDVSFFPGQALGGDVAVNIPVLSSDVSDNTIQFAAGTGWSFGAYGTDHDFLNNYLFFNMAKGSTPYPPTPETVWRGPYFKNLPLLDPWGHPYAACYSYSGSLPSRLYVLSAGADGVINTTSSATSVDAVDCGIVIPIENNFD
jgi:prepilin-type N-terminal cleavage/methylation domain-containing protein